MNDPESKASIIEAFLAGLLVLIVGASFGILLLEWAAGCGESYIDAYGQRHMYECVIVNRNGE